jgi:hypothetical protein
VSSGRAAGIDIGRGRRLRITAPTESSRKVREYGLRGQAAGRVLLVEQGFTSTMSMASTKGAAVRMNWRTWAEVSPPPSSAPVPGAKE